MSSIGSSRVFTALKTSKRVLIVLVTILALVTMSIAAAAANGFKTDLHCDAPSKLNYNIAIGVITLVLVPALLLPPNLPRTSSTPLSILRSPLLQIAFAALFAVLWAAAVGASVYTCADLCSACAGVAALTVRYAGRCCDCAGLDGVAGDACALGGTQAVIGYERRRYWYEATRGLDAGLLGLFVVFVAVEVVLLKIGRPVGGRSGIAERVDVMPLGRRQEGGKGEPPSYDEEDDRRKGVWRKDGLPA